MLVTLWSEQISTNIESAYMIKRFIAFILSFTGLGYPVLFGQSKYQNLSSKDFAVYIAQPDVQLLDVRTAEEFAESHLVKALHLNVKQRNFSDKAEKMLDRKNAVAIYCRSGRRSANAANILAEKGFTVVNLDGGILAWEKEKLPVVTKTN